MILSGNNFKFDTKVPFQIEKVVVVSSFTVIIKKKLINISKVLTKR